MSAGLRATYYDGRTTQPREVSVGFEDGVVRVRGDGVELDVLPGDVRISPRLGNAARSIRFREGDKCETADNDAVDALARMLGHSQRGAWLHRMESSWRLVLASLLLLVAVAAGGFVWGIPFAAKQTASRLPDAVAYRVGEGTLELLDESLFDETEVPLEDQQRLRLAFSRLAERAPSLPLTLEFRGMGAPNAFALPNGTVVVTDELVSLAENDHEIEAVLAHEIGHVHHRHALRMGLEASSVALLVSAYIGDAAQISALLSALPTMYAQASYSRTHETEADLYALDLMEQAQLDPLHFANVMKKLGDAAGPEAPDLVQYLSSHPPTVERIERFERRAHATTNAAASGSP